MSFKIHTKNLIIRQFIYEDLPAFARYRAIRSVAEYQSWSDYTFEDAVALYEGMNRLSFGKEDAWFQLAIELKESHVLAGDLAVHFIGREQVEVGFTLSPEFHKKGIATEALAGLLEYLFHDMKKHRVIAITDVRNTASCRLLEKTGFRKEAHFKENSYFKGSWGSEYVYAMLHSEWRGSSCQKKKI